MMPTLPTALRSTRLPALLAALTLALAGCSGDDGNGSDSDPSSTSSDTSTGDSMDTTAGPTTSTTLPTGTDSDSDSDSATDTQGTTEGMTDTDETTTTTTGVGGVCEESCALQEMCQGEPDPECVADCEDDRLYWDGVGSCGATFDEMLECVNGLDCEEFEMFVFGEETSCQDEYDAIFGDLPQCVQPDYPQACLDFCEALNECVVQELCIIDCTAEVAVAGFMSPECGAATEAGYACASQYSCQELMNNPGLCAAEAMAADEACS